MQLEVGQDDWKLLSSTVRDIWLLITAFALNQSGMVQPLQAFLLLPMLLCYLAQTGTASHRLQPNLATGLRTHALPMLTCAVGVYWR